MERPSIDHWSRISSAALIHGARATSMELYLARISSNSEGECKMRFFIPFAASLNDSGARSNELMRSFASSIIC